MLTVAYLAIRFPAAVEPYVADEIEELRSRGVRVVAGSVRQPQADQLASARCVPEIVLQSLSLIVLLRALWLCMREWKTILPLVGRAILRGKQTPFKRIKTMAHTWLGACYAVLLEGKAVDHIHVHHGYFGSWIAMVAARLLNKGFSMTLHGSDLLLHGADLDLKLESCTFCMTISEYNRRYILERYPTVDAAKVIVARMGVQISDRGESPGFRPEDWQTSASVTGCRTLARSERSCISGGGVCSITRPKCCFPVFNRGGGARTPQSRIADSRVEAGEGGLTTGAHCAGANGLLLRTTPMLSC